jgi:hypothetical protein
MPVRAPASSEQVAAPEASTAMPETPESTIPAVKSSATPKANPAADLVAVQSHDAEAAAPHEHESPQAAEPGADAAADSSMICDSKSVRGKFTGIGHSTPKLAKPAPAKEASPKPASQAVPMSSEDADPPCSHDACHGNAAGSSAGAPKPLGRVVNAVAHRIGHGPVADPFALEQTVDNSAVDPISIGEAHAPSSAEAPRPFHSDDANVESASSELLAADSTAAGQPSHGGTRFHAETWFAIGLGVGVAATLAMWLRSRPRREHALNG